MTGIEWDHETEAEREEREAVESGQILTDAEAVETADAEAEGYDWRETADAESPRYMFERF